MPLLLKADSCACLRSVIPRKESVDSGPGHGFEMFWNELEEEGGQSGGGEGPAARIMCSSYDLMARAASPKWVISDCIL